MCVSVRVCTCPHSVSVCVSLRVEEVSCIKADMGYDVSVSSLLQSFCQPTQLSREKEKKHTEMEFCMYVCS